MGIWKLAKLDAPDYLLRLRHETRQTFLLQGFLLGTEILVASNQFNIISSLVSSIFRWVLDPYIN
jgi:hypothetical protein